MATAQVPGATRGAVAATPALAVRGPTPSCRRLTTMQSAGQGAPVAAHRLLGGRFTVTATTGTSRRCCLARRPSGKRLCLVRTPMIKLTRNAAVNTRTPKRCGSKCKQTRNGSAQLKKNETQKT